MRSAFWCAALLVLVLSCTSSAERHVVEMSGFQFQPTQVNANVGDTIVFMNRDVVEHNATAEGAGWESGPIAPDSSWHVVLRESGRVEYLCTLHPTMTGTIELR